MKRSKERSREVTARAGVTDEDIFNVLSLSLIINRSVPDCFDDEEVLQHLRHVIQTHRHLIPFRVPWLSNKED